MAIVAAIVGLPEREILVYLRSETYTRHTSQYSIAIKRYVGATLRRMGAHDYALSSPRSLYKSCDTCVI